MGAGCLSVCCVCYSYCLFVLSLTHLRVEKRTCGYMYIDRTDRLGLDLQSNTNDRQKTGPGGMHVRGMGGFRLGCFNLGVDLHFRTCGEESF
jgi:hypothetical protein